MNSLGYKRLWLLVSSLLLFSCGKQSHWSVDQVRSGNKEFCSTKLSYQPQDPIRGISLEFLRMQERLSVYLNVHSMPVPPHRGDPQSVLITFEIAGDKQSTQIYRLEGGQRFLLPEEIATTLIHSLQAGQTVTFSLGNYQSVISPEDFAAKFKQFQSPSSFESPLNLFR